MKPSTIRHLLLEDTPVGQVLVVANGNAVSGVYLRAGKHYPDMSEVGPNAPFDDLLVAAGRELAEYFVGERSEFGVPTKAQGTEFQQIVWNALRDIPYGDTWSYGDLAAAIGRPSASRAVGLANGKNPISIIVPCHRVIGASGNLTGYGGGIENKKVLLELERSRLGSTLF
ncbi:methylated-DNA--[protein]-cysteine S-methyltransferase [Demetria terragena]|uniref:methylated-DNA--[protein]-cysteine S-methyltransferase n=1 Tax=Demetria terragena TaxID=63959 RepID=UPI000381C068|nr:methylated-DNA--[protein]-cysteine S-methyltransferase [Demetria terragena]